MDTSLFTVSQSVLIQSSIIFLEHLADILGKLRMNGQRQMRIRRDGSEKA